MKKTNTKKIEQIISNIGLALNAAHGLIATDLPEAQPDATHWRINHAKEIKQLKKLESYIKILSKSSGPGCGGHNKPPLRKPSKTLGKQTRELRRNHRCHFHGT